MGLNCLPNLVYRTSNLARFRALQSIIEVKHFNAQAGKFGGEESVDCKVCSKPNVSQAQPQRFGRPWMGAGASFAQTQT